MPFCSTAFCKWAATNAAARNQALPAPDKMISPPRARVFLFPGAGRASLDPTHPWTASIRTICTKPDAEPGRPRVQARKKKVPTSIREGA